MNLSGQLSIQAFTTVERVKALGQPSTKVTSQDALISTLIDGVSARMVRLLGLHAVQEERTELYQVRRFAKTLALDAKPIDGAATFSIRYGSHEEDLGSALLSRDYSVNRSGGWVRLHFRTYHNPGYAEVTYTGGLGTDTTDLIASFPELAAACDQQVSFLLQRAGDLGGSVSSIPGGGQQFARKYHLLDEVVAAIDMHRRGGPV